MTAGGNGTLNAPGQDILQAAERQFAEKGFYGAGWTRSPPPPPSTSG